MSSSATREFGSGVPLYCPHKGCRWDHAGSRVAGERYLAVHLRICHAGVDPRGDPSEPVLFPHRDPRMRGRPPMPKKWNRESMLDAIRAQASANGGLPPRSKDWGTATAANPTAARVVTEFGSWAEAVELAGFPRPQRGRTPAQLQASKEIAEADAACPPAVERDDGLTPEEGVVMDHLVAATEAFGALARQHPHELPDFVDGIHSCQNELAKRICRRTHPKGWPTKPRHNPHE